ncbi:hypothetical protein HDV02_004600 [Globomyces sp. JEL0801]|nr:hypothetical protein HDV02_004600 [Globomyces sp. JEL0801]
MISLHKPITMVYSPMYKVVGGDPTLKVLNASIAGSNPQKLNIQYDIHIVLPLISWTGYTITVPGSFSVDVAEMIGDQRPFVVQLLDKISQVIN